ncbi:MAG: TldD/PmbA family protein [Desulfurococcaceae archaeon]
MNTSEIAHRISDDLSRHYDEVAILLNQKENVMVKLWNTEPSVVQSWFDTEITVRLAKSGRLLILGFTTRDPEQVIGIGKKIIEYADKIDVSEIYSPLPENVKCSPIQDVYDHNIEKYMDDPSSLVDSIVDQATSYGVDRVAGTVTLGKFNRILVTSKGYECSETKTSIIAYARAFKGEFSGHWAYGSTRVDYNKIKEVGEKAGKYATLTKSRVELIPGKYRIAISPLVAGNLFNYIARMASALWVLIGFSFFGRYKPGDKVSNEQLSLFDKPRDSLLPGGAGFDDEGVETFDKPIIENGIMKTLLFNNGIASILGTKSTGNAGWIMPSPWNIEVSMKSDLNEDELVEELKEGLIITNNWYTRLQNYYEGVFSTVSRDIALVVRNGEIVGDAGRVRIASNFPHFLSNIEFATSKSYDISWWEVSLPTRTPYLVVKDVMVTKPEA